MRPQTNLRAAGAPVIAIALVLTAPLAIGAADAQSASPVLALSDPTPTFGQAVTVDGGADARYAGSPATLQFAAAQEGWQAIATARVAATGRYSFHARLKSSGTLRVVLGEALAGAETAASAEQVLGSREVSVQANLAVTARHLQVLAGRTATVTGFLQPAAPGRSVRLERRVGRAWRVIASDRTGVRGAYTLRFRSQETGSSLVRLSIDADSASPPTVRGLGRLSVYRATKASRYDLYGGALACGGRLGRDALVVAHKSLPCGTPVTIRYRGRVVHARVQDRGPFVGGREFDLAGGVARRLGFDGVGTIWVTA